MAGCSVREFTSSGQEDKMRGNIYMLRSTHLAFLYSFFPASSKQEEKERVIEFIKEKLREGKRKIDAAEDALTLAAFFCEGFDSEGGTKAIDFQSLDGYLAEDIPKNIFNYIEMLKIASELGHKAGSLELAKLYAGHSENAQLDALDKDLSDKYLEISCSQGSSTAKELLKQGGYKLQTQISQIRR